MSSTYVTVSGREGFWARDGLLEIWLRLAALHLPDPGPELGETNSAEVRRLREQWLLASRGWWTGMVPHDFEALQDNAVAMELAKAAARSLDRALHDATPAALPAAALNLLGWGSGVSYAEDLEVWRLVELTQAIQQLFDGQLDAQWRTRTPGSGAGPPTG